MKNTLRMRQKALACAQAAALEAGALMRRHQGSAKKVHSATQHDIKLELDVRTQKMIERRLLKAFPETCVLGEEGVAGHPDGLWRWIVDPIDGTVNYHYGIPHACVSIALQIQASAEWQSVVGVVYDPFAREMWTAIRGQPARLNGRVIRATDNSDLAQSMVVLGFSKSRYTLNKMLPVFNHLVYRVRKLRMMGSAALALTYVATGRFDLYTEYGVRLWDIAAGGLIVECAGGKFSAFPINGDQAVHMTASNGRLTQALRHPVFRCGFPSSPV